MNSPATKPQPCPCCGETLPMRPRKHCESPTCNWIRHSCKAWIDGTRALHINYIQHVGEPHTWPCATEGTNN